MSFSVLIVSDVHHKRNINFAGDLVLFYAGFNQFQMGLLEAVKTTVCPLAGVALLWVFVGASDDLWSDGSLVLALSQLLDEAFDVESVLLVEESHFAEDALHIALCLLVIWEHEFLIVVHFVFGYAERSGAFWPVSGNVFECLDFPFGAGVNLFIKI